MAHDTEAAVPRRSRCSGRMCELPGKSAQRQLVCEGTSTVYVVYMHVLSYKEGAQCKGLA